MAKIMNYFRSLSMQKTEEMMMKIARVLATVIMCLTVLLFTLAILGVFWDWVKQPSIKKFAVVKFMKSDFEEKKAVSTDGSALGTVQTVDPADAFTTQLAQEVLGSVLSVYKKELEVYLTSPKLADINSDPEKKTKYLTESEAAFSKDSLGFLKKKIADKDHGNDETRKNYTNGIMEFIKTADQEGISSFITGDSIVKNISDSKVYKKYHSAYWEEMKYINNQSPKRSLWNFLEGEFKMLGIFIAAFVVMGLFYAIYRIEAKMKSEV